MQTKLCLVATVVVIALAHQVSAPADVTAQIPAHNGRLLFEADEGACVPTMCRGEHPPHDLWTVAADGTGLTNVTLHPAAIDTQGQWSPDGSRIAFASNRNGDFDLFTIAPDGSDLTQLTSGDERDEYPAWSPNGRRIAFVRGGVRRSYDIFVMRADGTRLRRITAFGDSFHAFALDWSPDGRRIVFTKRRDSDIDNGAGEGNDDIYTIRPDGSDLRALVRTRLDENYPAWSPNGRWITFDRAICEAPGTEDEFCNWDIYTARFAGDRLVRRLTTSEAYDIIPTWSPDGTKIAYSSSAGDLSYGDIFVMDPDGSNKTPFLRKPDSIDYGVNWQPLP